MADTRTTTRGSGILLHPTSLPGPFAIGDLGPTAFAWIDALAGAGQTWWQILPLGPTTVGDSPYQCFSAFAGNPLLVSPERLVEDGLVSANDIEGASFDATRVDYSAAHWFKRTLLDRAWKNFRGGRAQGLRSDYDAFRNAQLSWLDDFALFMALKDANGGKSWSEWPDGLRLRHDKPLREAARELQEAWGFHAFTQFLFFRQWHAVRAHAKARGVRIIGDMPIFVSGDSADVWANPQFFQLDANRRPTKVAGVPPDYFNADGQLWGNPLYDWDALERSDFAWWKARLRAATTQVDLIRLDHFRGFESYWEIAADSPTARVGRWVPAPGDALLASLRREFGELPLIAEDLGIITPAVEGLRDRFALPGMKVLQFAFGDDFRNLYLPHNYTSRCVAYTGTHDNDTTLGWYRGAPEKERDHVRRYLARDGSDVAWDFIRLAWSSVAETAIAPLQDVLCLGSEARMNFPGRADGNWRWRLDSTTLPTWAVDRLAETTWLFGRARHS